MAGAVAVRPTLWPAAVRQALRLARPGWWRRPPFVPVPPPAYRRFRAVTQYGDAGHRMEAEDVVGYLEWCRRWRSWT